MRVSLTMCPTTSRIRHSAQSEGVSHCSGVSVSRSSKRAWRSWCTSVQTSVPVDMRMFLRSEGSDFRSSGETERRVPIGEKADVGLDPQGIAIDVDKEVPDPFGVLPGYEHGEQAEDDAHAGGEAQSCHDEVLRNGQEPLVQRLPPLEVFRIGQTQ